MEKNKEYICLQFISKDKFSYPYFESLKRYFEANYKEKLVYFDNINAIKVKKIFREELINSIKKDFPLFKAIDISVNFKQIDKNNLKNIYSDNTDKLIENKILFKSDNPGIFIESSEYADTKMLLDNYLKSKINHEMGNIIELCVPSSISNETIIKTGYIDKFTDIVLAISSIYKEKDSGEIIKKVNNSPYLSPTVCFRIFPTARELLKKNPNIAKKVLSITCRAQCFRNEIHNNKTSLRRLNEFSMREYIFIGSQKNITRYINSYKKIIESLLKDLGLNNYDVEFANDAFFIGAFRTNSKFQKLMKLKEEFVFPIDGQPLSFISINMHKKTMLNAFNIMPYVKDYFEEPSSACIGFGLDRIMLILYSVYGISNKKISEIIKNKCI